MKSCVIFDLDGTLIDSAAEEVVKGYGKELPANFLSLSTGKRAIDIYTYLAKELEIDESPEKLLEQSQKILVEKFSEVKLMPGAIRLLEYFQRIKIPMALATGTVRDMILVKLKGREFVLDFFRELVGGDEVQTGKPDPGIFLLTASRMKVDPADCLVFEDSLLGVEAATKAGMDSVYVPSTLSTEDPLAKPIGSNVVELKSLLDFNPKTFGLPPIGDSIEGVIKMDPFIQLSGTVALGFGRGAKELGIRTANVDDASLSDQLASAVTGIYAGWASLGDSTVVYPMVMSIGWNPFYNNRKRTAEAWLLHEFPEDFYGTKIRLLAVGYIRPESNFDSLDALIAQIQEDAEVARKFLAAEDIKNTRPLPCTETSRGGKC